MSSSLMKKCFLQCSVFSVTLLFSPNIVNKLQINVVVIYEEEKKLCVEIYPPLKANQNNLVGCSYGGELCHVLLSRPPASGPVGPPRLQPRQQLTYTTRSHHGPHAESNNTKRGNTRSSTLKFEPFADPFWLSALHRRFRRRGANIFVDLSLFVLLFNTNFMNKLKCHDCLKTKN